MRRDRRPRGSRTPREVTATALIVLGALAVLVSYWWPDEVTRPHPLVRDLDRAAGRVSRLPLAADVRESVTSTLPPIEEPARDSGSLVVHVEDVRTGAPLTDAVVDEFPSSPQFGLRQESDESRLPPPDARLSRTVTVDGLATLPDRDTSRVLSVSADGYVSQITTIDDDETLVEIKLWPGTNRFVRLLDRTDRRPLAGSVSVVRVIDFGMTEAVQRVVAPGDRPAKITTPLTREAQYALRCRAPHHHDRDVWITGMSEIGTSANDPLDVLLGPADTLSVRVLADTTGDPVAGATVRKGSVILGRTGQDGTLTTTSGSLASGFVAEVSADGLETARVQLRTAVGDGPHPEQEVRLGPEWIIEGVVRERDGTAAPRGTVVQFGGQLAFLPEDRAVETVWPGTVTGDGGRFRITGLSRRFRFPATIKATAPDGRSAQLLFPSLIEKPGLPLTLSPRDSMTTVTITVRAEPAGHIERLRLTATLLRDLPLDLDPGSALRLRSDGAPAATRTFTATGHRKTFTVQVRAEGTTLLTASGVGHDSKHMVLSPRTAPLPKHIDMVLHATRPITGTVETGPVPPDVPICVVAYTEGGPPVATTTADATGAFSLLISREHRAHPLRVRARARTPTGSFSAVVTRLTDPSYPLRLRLEPDSR